MKQLHRLGLWWVPLVLVLVPAAGWAVGHRDLLDYFAAGNGRTIVISRKTQQKAHGELAARAASGLRCANDLMTLSSFNLRDET